MTFEEHNSIGNRTLPGSVLIQTRASQDSTVRTSTGLVWTRSTRSQHPPLATFASCWVPTIHRILSSPDWRRIVRISTDVVGKDCRERHNRGWSGESELPGIFHLWCRQRLNNNDNDTNHSWEQLVYGAPSEFKHKFRLNILNEILKLMLYVMFDIFILEFLDIDYLDIDTRVSNTYLIDYTQPNGPLVAFTSPIGYNLIHISEIAEHGRSCTQRIRS